MIRMVHRGPRGVKRMDVHLDCFLRVARRMKSLNHPEDRAALLARLQRVRPETPRQWGRMTAAQMICHLTDSFQGVMGERDSPSPPPRVPRLKQRIMKFVALQMPLPWPHGLKTRPHADQELGGTRPGDFTTDVAKLVRSCERFAVQQTTRAPHYLFGPLNHDEWGRWGYRHMDHHLRQFGV